MQSLSYHIAISLDGFIAGPAGEFTGFVMEGPHVADYLQAIASASAVVMGRKTYQVGLDHGVVDPYPHVPTHVFSRSLTQRPHANVSLLQGDVATELRGLLSKPGRGVVLIGGGELAGLALEAGLLDEIVVKVNPFVAGQGIPLFAPGTPRRALSLVSTTAYDSGVTTLRYRVVK